MFKIPAVPRFSLVHVTKIVFNISNDNFHPGDKCIFEHPDLHIRGQFVSRAICKDVPDQDALLQRYKRVSKVKTWSKKFKLVDRDLFAGKTQEKMVLAILSSAQ